MSHSRPVQVHINTAALQHNSQRVRELVPNSKIMAVIKADGYGHGMEIVADALSSSVDEFAVNSLDDVLRIRNAGFDKAITVLSANFNKQQLLELVKLNARITLYDSTQLPVLASLDEKLNLSIWLKVDTGMGRLGFLPEELPNTLDQVNKIKAVSNISLMTHLANADQVDNPASGKQIDVFNELAAVNQFTELSILNSAGVLALPEYALQRVRPGIMLYGISPLVNQSAEQLGLQAVMTFKSKLISIRRLPAGSSIGYGSTYVVDDDTRIGVIACGYGDGYPRHAPTGTPVLINGLIVPLIGRVSMDMICVDLNNITAKVGDDAILWGEGNPVEVVADYAQTIAYELVCGILPRVERIVN